MLVDNEIISTSRSRVGHVGGRACSLVLVQVTRDGRVFFTIDFLGRYVIRGESADPILHRCQQRQRLFSSGSILDWKKKKKEEKEKLFIFDRTFFWRAMYVMPFLRKFLLWYPFNYWCNRRIFFYIYIYLLQ